MITNIVVNFNPGVLYAFLACAEEPMDEADA